MDCGLLENPSNGQVTLSGTVFESVATYQCDSGFNLVGNVERVCQASGEWSGTDASCDGKFS